MACRREYALTLDITEGFAGTVRLERNGERAQIAVTDTGMGIRPEILPHLFSKFVQADSSVTRTHGGLGLGLAIVRHLVEAHGGEVRAESAGEGQGATFHVVLPLGAARMVEGPAAVARDLTGVRVLVVEDDEDTRASLAATLEELGAVVRAAPSAAAGRADVEAFLPQVILSDIAMPGEDAGSPDPAEEAGFQMHVARPIEGVQLAAVVRALAAMPLVR